MAWLCMGSIRESNYLRGLNPILTGTKGFGGVGGRGGLNFRVTSFLAICSTMTALSLQNQKNLEIYGAEGGETL